MNSKKTFRTTTGWGVALASSLVNFLILIIYQSKIGGDFPFQDEWGYVDRLIHLHQTGFFHYLFDHYQTYYQPGLFAIWYFFYKFFHLSIMAMRYTGAGISAIVAMLICVLAIRKKERFYFSELILVALIPFVFCSLNHFATYNQSIESIIEPLLFGFIFLSCWAGQETINSNVWKKLLWSGVIVLLALLGLSMYAPALAIILAVVIVRVLLLRKGDITTLGLGFLGLAIGLVYSSLGGGLNHIHQLMESSLENDLIEWIILFGNAVIAIGDHKVLMHMGNPSGLSVHQISAFMGGMVIVSTLIILMVQTIFSQVNDRMKYFIPFALSLYTFGVSFEIVLRYNDPNFGEAPRYAIHMVGGPIAILVWGILASESLKKIKLVILSIFFIFLGTASVFISVSEKISYVKHSFNMIRTELERINNPITDQQQKNIFVGSALKNLVFPDLQFLRENRLALFYNSHSAPQKHHKD